MVVKNIAGKVPHWYLVQEGDATMLHNCFLARTKK